MQTRDIVKNQTLQVIVEEMFLQETWRQTISRTHKTRPLGSMFAIKLILKFI